MKKLFGILIVLLSLSLCTSAFAGTVNAVFTWTQSLPTPNDMKEWRIYKATAAGVQTVPANLLVTVPYVSTQTQYTTTQVMTSPDGQKVQYFFVMTAGDQSGNVSAKSNEVNAWIDFQSPEAPGSFSLTISVVPTAP